MPGSKEGSGAFPRALSFKQYAESDSQPLLNWMTQKAKIRTSLLSKVWEAPMPHYEFFCHACKKTFVKILALVDYEEGRVTCPHCGSHRVEQCWSAFSVITSKKSA
jgi:putative FmdB family regulatory protein